MVMPFWPRLTSIQLLGATMFYWHVIFTEKLMLLKKFVRNFLTDQKLCKWYANKKALSHWIMLSA